MRLQYFIEDDLEVAQDAMSLLETAIFMDKYNHLDEGILSKLGDFKKALDDKLRKIGLHTAQSKGLIQYLFTINKNIIKLLYYGIELSDAAPHAREKAREEILKIKNSVTKEEVLNFLYRLDKVTLGIITTPLKMIDGLTGWHISGDIKHKVEPALEKARKAIEWLEATKEELTGKLKAQLQKYVNALRRVFNFGDFKKISA
jgi:hypothetical protein